MILSEYVRLHRSFEKPASTVFHKYISKNIALIVGYFCYSFKITPNVMSMLSFILLFVSLFFLTSNYMVLAILTSQLSYSFDCADGVIARIQGSTSKFGAFFDVFLDRVGSVLIAASMTVILVENYDWGLLSAFTVSLCPIFYFTANLARLAYLPRSIGAVKSGDVQLPIILRLAYEFLDTGIFLFLVYMSVSFQILGLVSVMYAVLYMVMTLALIIVAYKRAEDWS